MRGSSTFVHRHNEVVSASNSHCFGVSLGSYSLALESASSLLMISGTERGRFRIESLALLCCCSECQQLNRSGQQVCSMSLLQVMLL